MKRPCLGCRVLIPAGSYCRRCLRQRRGTGGTQQAFRRRTLKSRTAAVPDAAWASKWKPTT
jgi:hypothetical protein